MQSQLTKISQSHSILNSFVTLALLTIFVAANPAAALEERDWQAADDGLLTFDPDTGLEWLDLTETTGLSVGDVTEEFGPGGDFEGFRYATAEEVGSFYTNAGLSGFATAANTVTGNATPVQVTAAEDLQDLWGITREINTEGFSLAVSNGYIDESLGDGVYRLAVLNVQEIFFEGSDNWSAGTRGSTASGALAIVGSALVRQTSPFRDELFGAESDTGFLLDIDPEAGPPGMVIGDTTVRQVTALAKDPVTGVLFGAGHPVYFSYETTIELDSPFLDGIDLAVFEWTTDRDTGHVGEKDLIYLSMSLYEQGEGLTLVYTDTPIIGGVPQPIGGVEREITDIFWDFDHGTGLNQLFNASLESLETEESSGVHYQVTDGETIALDPTLIVIKFEDGEFAGRADSPIVEQDTESVGLEQGEIIPTLFSFDQTNAEKTIVGVIECDEADSEFDCDEDTTILSVNGASIDASGQLWAAVTVEEDTCGEGCFDEFEGLARIDKTNGSAVIIGDFGEVASYDIEGISFDSEGILWGVSSDHYDPELFIIDLEDGNAVFETELDMPPGDGGFNSLQYACDDTLYGGTAEVEGESEGGGGILLVIDRDSGELTQIGSIPFTDGSTLGGLALQAPCGTFVVNSPTPVGEEVTVIEVQVFEQVAAEVVVAGFTDAFFCVMPDIRYFGHTFVARDLNLLELSGMGSCTGPLEPGGSETWEVDVFPNLNLVIASWFQSYHGKFTLPGDSLPTEDYWLVLGVVRSTAEYDGPVAYVSFPETLIDYTDTTPAETPGCNRNLPWRTLDIAGAVPAFGDFPNFEGNRMIVETAQCNGPRSMTRRTTHVFPTRFIYPAMGPFAEFMNLAAQLSGISGTVVEAASCADMTLLMSMQMSLQAAQMSFAMSQFAAAEEHLEQIARFANQTVTGFDGCDVERNYRGNFMSRAVTAAFTVHDRFEHPVNYMKYFPPADLELPILDPEPPP